MKTKYKILSVIWMLFLVWSISSCAASKRASVEDQRRAYMIQDKSQLSRNKGKFKPSSTHKVHRRKNLKRMKKQRRR